MDIHLLVALAFVAGILSAALLSFACLRLIRRYRIPLLGWCRNPVDLELGPADARVGPEAVPDSSEKKDPGVPRRFAWAELESLTGGFAAEAAIGEGGFSTVYLARLSSPGGGPVLVAVKLTRPSERLHRAFRQELDVLLSLRHPYVVRLLGYCDDCEQGVLVFEYVTNGSLHEKLHGRTAGDALSWAQRMTIAYKVAEALEYLHEGCDPQIVHGDVKASNVLLDDRLEPKLCDFGSARVGFSAAVQPLPTSGRSASRQMMGSPGYVDPHYIRSGMVSKKSDVYSFGVLLLELVTGAEAYDSEREQQMLAAAMRPVLKEAADGQSLQRVIDGRLNGKYDAGEATAAAEVAAMCVGDNPSLRPSMTELVRILGEQMSSSISTLRSKSDGARDM